MSRRLGRDSEEGLKKSTQGSSFLLGKAGSQNQYLWSGWSISFHIMVFLITVIVMGFPAGVPSQMPLGLQAALYEFIPSIQGVQEPLPLYDIPSD